MISDKCGLSVTVHGRVISAAKDPDCPNHKPFITVKSEDGTEQKFYSIFSEDIPEEMLQRARDEVNETEEKKREGIRILREYIQKENMTNVGDEYLIAALRCCKYDIKKSKAKLARLIKIYDGALNKIRNFHFDEVCIPLNENGIGLFPYRDSKGRVIFFVRSFLQLYTLDMKLLESGFLAVIFYLLTLPHASLLGFSIVIDSEVPAVRCYYTVMKLFMLVIPQVVRIPYRLACIKILNENVLAGLVYRLVRPFVPEKINKRIFFFSKDDGEIHKDYPPEMMPEEYGGHVGPMNAELYRKKMMVMLKNVIEAHSQ